MDEGFMKGSHGKKKQMAMAAVSLFKQDPFAKMTNHDADKQSRAYRPPPKSSILLPTYDQLTSTQQLSWTRDSFNGARPRSKVSGIWAS